MYLSICLFILPVFYMSWCLIHFCFFPLSHLVVYVLYICCVSIWFLFIWCLWCLSSNCFFQNALLGFPRWRTFPFRVLEPHVSSWNDITMPWWPLFQPTMDLRTIFFHQLNIQTLFSSFLDGLWSEYKPVLFFVALWDCVAVPECNPLLELLNLQ